MRRFCFVSNWLSGRVASELGKEVGAQLAWKVMGKDSLAKWFSKSEAGLSLEAVQADARRGRSRSEEVSAS